MESSGMRLRRQVSRMASAHKVRPEKVETRDGRGVRHGVRDGEQRFANRFGVGDGAERDGSTRDFRFARMSTMATSMPSSDVPLITPATLMLQILL